MSIISRFRFLFLILISLLLFFIVYYFDDNIRKVESFEIKVWFYVFKSISIYIYGSVLFTLFSDKWVLSSKKHPYFIVVSFIIFLVNILTTVYHIELHSLGYNNPSVQIFLNENNKVLINIIAGYMLGFALFNKA